MDTVEMFPIGSRTTVLDPTKIGLTSEFGMGSGVSLPSVTVSSLWVLTTPFKFCDKTMTVSFFKSRVNTIPLDLSRTLSSENYISLSCFIAFSE